MSKRTEVVVSIELSGKAKSCQMKSYVAVEILRQVFDWAEEEDWNVGGYLFELMSALRGPDESIEGADELKKHATELVRRGVMGRKYTPGLCNCLPRKSSLDGNLLRRAKEAAQQGEGLGHTRAHLGHAIAAIEEWLKVERRRGR